MPPSLHDIRQMHEAGESPDVIASRFGVSERFIRRVLESDCFQGMIGGGHRPPPNNCPQPTDRRAEDGTASSDCDEGEGDE